MSLTDQGIAAYNAGEREEAARLLSDAVRDDEEKRNPDAWFYLAQLMSDPEKKRQCLQRVLRLDPSYPEAQQQLDELDGGTSAGGGEEPLRDVASKPQRTASTSGLSLGMLTSIPGAPNYVGVPEITAAGQDFAKRTQSALTMNTDAATGNASWWSVFTTTALVSFVSGLCVMLREIIGTIRFETDLDFPLVLTVTFVVMIVGIAAAYAGAFVSYWYATKQAGGDGGMLDHFQAAITLWAPAAILTSLLVPIEVIGIATGDFFLNNVFTLDELVLQGIPDRSGFSWVLTLIALGATVFTLFLMNKRFSGLHSFGGAKGWISGVLMLVVVAFVYSIGI